MGSIWLSYPYLAPKFCCCRLLITLQQPTLHYFSLGVGWQWGSQPWEVVQSPSLEVFKAWLDKALSNHLWPPSCPCSEHQVGLRSSFQKQCGVSPHPCSLWPKNHLWGHFRNCLLCWHDSQRTAGVSVLLWRRPTPIYLLGCSAEAQENRFLLNTNILPSL